MAKRNPDLTKERILDAATVEFSTFGLGGARIDAIAERAGANKRMLYHYFGNKEDLFLAVLEQAYAQIRRHERSLRLEDMDPETAIRELVTFTFKYFVKNPEFIQLLNNENLYKAEHIMRSKQIPAMHSPLVDHIRDVLKRGEASGVFRTDVDPVQLYITIAAVGYFYLSNANTLGTIFKRNLLTRAALNTRMAHCVAVVLGYVRA